MVISVQRVGGANATVMCYFLLYEILYLIIQSFATTQVLLLLACLQFTSTSEEIHEGKT